MNFSTALEFGRQGGVQLPQNSQIRLIGIEAEDILTFREHCTPAVQAAISEAVETVLKAVDELMQGEPT